MSESTAPVPYAQNQYAEDPLSGRVAVITGASSGIGEALAHALSARGVRLVARRNANAMRSSDGMESMRKRASGGSSLISSLRAGLAAAA